VEPVPVESFRLTVNARLAAATLRLVRLVAAVRSFTGLRTEPAGC
jgi:hypothetical protein